MTAAASIPNECNVHPTYDVTAVNRQFQSITRSVRRERGVRARLIIASLDALPHVFSVVVKIYTFIHIPIYLLSNRVSLSTLILALNEQNQ